MASVCFLVLLRVRRRRRFAPVSHYCRLFRAQPFSREREIYPWEFQCLGVDTPRRYSYTTNIYISDFIIIIIIIIVVVIMMRILWHRELHLNDES